MAFKLLGISDERTTCDCCGKTGLKRTVAMESDALGLVFYGTGCAGAALHGRKTPANTTRTVRDAEAVDANRAAVRKSKLQRIRMDGNEANRAYIHTNRPIEGSYFGYRGCEIVRIDGNDGNDATFFAAEGFVRPPV